MSIQYQWDDNYVLSHAAKLNDVYLLVDEEPHKLATYTSANPAPSGYLKSYEVKDTLFEINSEYVRPELQSASNSSSSQPDDDEIESPSRKETRKQKRAKRRHAADQDDTQKEMQEVIDTISHKCSEFRELAAAVEALQASGHSGRKSQPPNPRTDNASAMALAKAIQDEDDLLLPLRGENRLDNAIVATVSRHTYLIPPKCIFYQNDIRLLDTLLGPRPSDSDDISAAASSASFDLVVIDPPWWNRYVRRAKQAKPSAGYEMLDSETILSIPLQNYVRANSVVAIWCTNAPSHMRLIENELLAKWSLKLLSTWYWVKVTRSGQPVCPFRQPLQKQPFERLYVACHIDSDADRFASLRPTRHLFSVPSAVHSHKPPLIELFRELLPDQPKCLELFARYLMPSFTSVGYEVLKLQNTNIYVNVNDLESSGEAENGVNDEENGEASAVEA